ncbi:MAG TPA: phosphodiester glycosidase family protein [Tepidisphaeraceae bacterium]|nr:phosphodiester glycosidase family protein [Tepidisphaeraceae bacterium]
MQPTSRIIVIVCAIFILVSTLLIHFRSRPYPKLQLELPLTNHAGTYRETIFPAYDSDHPAWSSRVAHLFPGHYTVALVDHPNNDSASAPWLETTFEERHALLAINGGYFDANLRPIGWRVIGGQETSPPIHSPPYSAVFCITADAVSHISWVQDAPPHPILAIQSGPLLVEPGGQIGIHPPAGPIAFRTLLALTPGGNLLVITTTPVSLLHLAQALTEHPESFGADRIDSALNLDGGPSTGMFVQTPTTTFRFPAPGPLREALIITP